MSTTFFLEDHTLTSNIFLEVYDSNSKMFSGTFYALFQLLFKRKKVATYRSILALEQLLFQLSQATL